jgi:hypothetical protein
MESTQVTTGGTQVAQRFVRCELVSDLSQPALGADLRIYDQADKVVANKEARDTSEAEQAARVCGCPHCRCAYRATLDFYATLGTGQPAHERISADYLVWYSIHVSGSQ